MARKKRSLADEIARGMGPPAGPTGDPSTDARLSLLGRTMLGAAGLTDRDIKRAYQVHREGMEAVNVKVFQYEGDVVLGPAQVDFTERRESANVVLKIADHFPARLEHELTGSVNFTIDGINSCGI